MSARVLAGARLSRFSLTASVQTGKVCPHPEAGFAMSKSMVEKYEQLLAQDPTSTVFVELARAYLDKGDNQKAIEVCQQGVVHHPNSVTARVLWGKALINVGRAAEAMKQFDLATNVDRDNPHAYNLIGEALLRKGLFRSALPILRKAAALQPNDGRIAQWLEQTKAALAGGPAPVLYDSTTTIDLASLPNDVRPPPPPPPSVPPATSAPRAGAPAIAPAPSPSRATGPKGPLPPPPPPPSAPPVRARASAPKAAPPVLAPVPPAPSPFELSSEPETALNAGPSDADVFASFLPPSAEDAQEQPTVVMQAYEPATTKEPAFSPPTPSAPPPVADGRSTLEIPVLMTKSESELPVVGGTMEEDDAPNPFATITPRPDPDTVTGLTQAFDALAVGALAEVPHAAPASASGGARVSSEPAVVVAPDPLFEDLSTTSEYHQPPERASARPVASSPSGARRGGGLLADIPDEIYEPVSASEAPRVEFNTQATEAIAKEYERELREKLEATKKKKTFLQRFGLPVAVVAVLVVVALGFGGSYYVTQQRNHGDTLDSAIAKGLTGISADTREQYLAALKALDLALTMDDTNTAAQAYRAYAHGMLYAEHGKDAKDRDAALASLTGTVRTAWPDYALVTDYLVADDASLTAARQQLLGSTMQKSLVQAHIGRLLMADKKYDEALTHLKKATELDPRQTLALVSLGNYYLTFEDWDSALDMLARAEPLSKFHPERVLGHAEARLELGRELPEALSDLAGLPASAAVPEKLLGRYALLLGRAQSANGKHDEALKTLTDGLAGYGKTMAFPYQMALGQAARNAGQMALAQKSYEEALKLMPRSEDAKEGLGRVLLARSRERELLDRLKPEKDLRRVALLRGIAWSRLGEQKKAREELAKTQVGGKYPSEAAVYLALADAAEEGQGEKAVEALEKLAAMKTRQKATVQVALARVYMQKNQLDKAKVQLEEAAKDPLDYEGNALLGQLLLDAGVPLELALEPLQRAVERNGSHGPSRHLLTRTLLALGRTAEAGKQVEAWTADNPALEQAWRDAALVWLEAGRLKEAEAAITKVPASSEDVEGWRTRARVLFARGNGAAALAALQRGNKLDPKDAETFCEIGNAFVRKSSAEPALAAFAAAARENPKATCAVAGPLHAHPTSRGGKPGPVELLQAALAKATTAWDKAYVQATLARVYLEARDPKNALAAAEEATTTAPGSPYAWFALGEAHRRQREDDQAREAYSKAAELDGSWSSVHLALADLLVKQGGDALPRAASEYELIEQIDENELEANRAKRTATALRKQLQK